MPDKYLEKTFLYLTLLSALLHAAAYGLISLIPAQPQTVEKVTMVELQDLPEPPSPPPPAPPKPKPEPEPRKMVEVQPRPVPVPVPAAKLPRLPAELALPQPPKKGDPNEKASPEPSAEKKTAPQAGKNDSDRQDSRSVGKADSVFRTPEKGGQESARGAKKIELAKLFPSAKKMSNLEEGYREKYRGSEQGDTRMMDTTDPLVAVFSHRILVAANTSVAIESAKRVVRGKNAIGVVMVTINRDGSIDAVQMIESTRDAFIDQLFIDSIYKTGYVGPLPKKWPHEKLKLIWIAVSRAPVMAP